MTWICSEPRCGRVTKGFPNGRTLCHVCRRCAMMQEKRLEAKK